MIEAAKIEPVWCEVAKHMVRAWNEGMETLRSLKAALHFRGLDSAIEGAGFSGPSKPERSREVIDRSELLASNTERQNKPKRTNLTRNHQRDRN